MRFKTRGLARILAVFLILLYASPVLSPLQGGAVSKAAATASTQLLRLTNTSYDNYFPSSPNSRPRAHGANTVWYGSPTQPYSPYQDNNTVYSYSVLNATSGTLRVVNLTADRGYLDSPQYQSGSDIFGFDSGYFVRSEYQPSSKQYSVLALNTITGASQRVPIPTNGSYTISSVPGFLSFAGNYFVAGADTFPQKLPPRTYPGVGFFQVFTSTGAGWSQFTPSNQVMVPAPCGTPQWYTLYEPTSVKGVIASGPGKFAYYQSSWVYDSFNCDILRPVVHDKIDKLILEDGTVVSSFYPGYAGNWTKYPTDPTCNLVPPCFTGFYISDGNLLVYAQAIPGINGYTIQSRNAVIYDRSNGAKTVIKALPAGPEQSPFVTDGKSVIWVGNGTGSYNVYLYNPRFGDEQISHDVGQDYSTYHVWVNGRWAVWENSSNYLNVFDIATDSMHSSFHVSSVDPTASIALGAQPPVGQPLLVLGDQSVAWVVDEGTSTPVGYLYSYNLGFESKASPVTKTSLKFLQPFSYAPPRIVDMVGSGGWVFFNAAPPDSDHLQIFAVQPFTGLVDVTDPTTKERLPLKEVQVTVGVKGFTDNVTTFTDDNGYFSFLLPGPLNASGPAATFMVNLTQRDGKFRVMDYSGNPQGAVNKTILYGTSDLRPIRVNNYFVDLDASVLAGRASTKTTMGPSMVGGVVGAAAIYARTFQAYQLLRDVLQSGSIIDRTIDVRAFSRAPGVYFFGGGSGIPEINIDINNSRITDPNSPMNREWHEFGHAVMCFSQMGGGHSFPNCHSVRGDKNHGGYANSNSCDSWKEGWAEFYSLLVGFYIQHNAVPSNYVWAGGVSNLDANWPIYANVGTDEEFGVASTMWDLFDSGSGAFNYVTNTWAGADNENVSIPITQIWQTVNSNRSVNIYQIWREFKGIPSVNQTFILHKIFDDVNRNGRYDPGEPIGTTRWAWVRQGSPLTLSVTSNPVNGTIVIPSRPGRQDLLVYPSSLVRLALVDAATGTPVPDVEANVTITAAGREPYTYTVRLQNGSSPFHLVLPENSTTSLFVWSPGYSASTPVTVSSSTFLTKIYESQYLNMTDVDLAQVNGSLSRIVGAMKDYSVAVQNNGVTGEATVSTDVTLVSGTYDRSSSTIILKTTAPSGYSGKADVMIPNELNNGAYAVTLNGSPASAHITQGATNVVVSVSLGPGDNKLEIRLVSGTVTTTTSSTSVSISSSSSTSSATSATANSVTTSAASPTQTTSEISVSTTSPGSLGLPIPWITLELIVGVVVVIVVVGALFARTRRKKV